MRIELHHLGYRIRLTGDRRSYEARSVAELQEAVAHYYGHDHDHGRHLGVDPDSPCPLCRAMARTTRRERV